MFGMFWAFPVVALEAVNSIRESTQQCVVQMSARMLASLS